MKVIKFTLAVAIMTGMAACSRTKTSNSISQAVPSIVKYENELFSIELPKEWTFNDENWNGLDKVQNEVDFYNSKGDVVWFHCVKSFFPFEHESIESATEMAKFSRAISGDDVELYYEIDSVSVDNYPASILYFANYVDNDTLIQKQYVTYMKDSHIVIYFNMNYYYRDLEVAEDIGTSIINTIKLKQVKNPLEDSLILNKALEKLNNMPI